MSIEAMALALNHSEATGTAKVVLLGIASHEGDLGAFPAIERLARYANCTPDNVRRALRKLEAAGELETVRNGAPQNAKPAHMRTNLYRVAIGCPDWCDRTSQHRDTRKFAAPQTDRPAYLPPSKTAGPHPAPVRGEPKDNYLPNGNPLSRSEVMEGDELKDFLKGGEDHVAEKAQEDQREAIAERARRRMIDAREAEATASQATPRYRPAPAPRIPRYDPGVEPRKPERLPEEMQARNRAAVAMKCPEGIAPKFNHMMLITTGEGCAHCGRSTDEIVDGMEIPA